MKKGGNRRLNRLPPILTAAGGAVTLSTCVIRLHVMVCFSLRTSLKISALFVEHVSQFSVGYPLNVSVVLDHISAAGF